MQILKTLTKYYLYMMMIFFIGRLSLFVIYFSQFKGSDVNYWLSFIYGARMDTIIAAIFLIFPLLLLTFSPAFLKNIINTILKYYFLIVFVILIYIENATLPFVAQYNVRPNYLFVEYLIYPKEVFATIFSLYKIELFVTFLLIIIFSYLYLKYYKNNFLNFFNTHFFKRILWFFPLALILFIGIRSSFGHRPANISDAMYSSNRMVNEITKNSLYSITYAVYVNQKYSNINAIKQYGKMEITEALLRVKSRLGIQNTIKDLSLTRLEKTHFKAKNSKNLVIFIQESIGYQFVGALGGDKNITPNLNKLSKQGILFKDLYANGTRSIRGIAGIVAGNFSIPGKGVIKRNKSQTDFFTIAKLLKPFNYHTSFIYGGESRFDNMKGWFLGNGFDTIIDQPKFKNPSFVGSWGVSDEDLVIRANQMFKTYYKNKQKFASVMFSTSNHAPFDFPENKIKLIPGVAKKSVKNAIRYADFAIGEFIELAKKEKYYQDTIFVIIADHNIRVYGSDLVPVNMFQVSGLILGKDIQPMIYDKLTTQPDVLATALDLIGLDLTYPIMGHSIFSQQKQNIGFMQFHDSYALRVDNKVVVLNPNKQPITFLYKNQHLIKTLQDKQLEKDALAFIVVLDYLYHNKLY